MRVDLERWARAHRSIRWRSITLLVFGIGSVLFGLFWMFFAVLVLVLDGDDYWDQLYAPTVGLGLGLFPFVVGLGLTAWGIAGQFRKTRLRDLATLARHTPSFSLADVARALELSPKRAGAVVLDAASLGILFDEPQPIAASNGWSATLPASVLESSGALSGRVLKATWRVEDQLGAGGMGEVYLARHVRTGRGYAIKTLLPSARLSPEAIKRFEREATAASALGHPGIVAVHDFDCTPDGIWFLVMDLLRGETLEQRLHRLGSLDWREAQRIALELCAALSGAHAHGLLHRDLKPANVFLERAEPNAPERVVLLDFGLVKPIDDAAISRVTATGAAVGTPMYMSPEQARGDYVDVRSDVYGLAAVLYEMLTGAPPFFDRTLAAVYARLLTESAPSLSAVAPRPCPPELDQLLSRALSKDPAQRFQSANELGQALASVPGLAAWSA
jgi:serine/threonine-protein kinase